MQNGLLDFIWQNLPNDYKTIINGKRWGLMWGGNSGTVLAPLEQVAANKVKQYRAAKLKRLLCSCCGTHTMGRQWRNRDDGHGLCCGCIDFTKQGVTPLEHIQCYGLAGVHYDLVEV